MVKTTQEKTGSGYISFKALKTCYAKLWSYGEICVGCGCCSKDVRKRQKARLEYWKWWLEENLNFNNWIDGWRETQVRNVKNNIKKAKIRVKYYERACQKNAPRQV